MDDLHAAIAAYLRGQRRDVADDQRVARVKALLRQNRGYAPSCEICGRSIDDDAGLFNLADMWFRRQCADHYCPF